MQTMPTPLPSAQPARHEVNMLGQPLNYIPRSIVNQAAARHGIEFKVRSFSIWSHLATMILCSC